MHSRFRVRFKSFIEQYELRELHFHSQMRTKEIELQYHLARFDRDKKAAEAELAKMGQLQTQVQTLSRSETQARTELNMYIEKLGEACNVKKSNLSYSVHTNKGIQAKAALDQRDDIVARQRKEMQEQAKKCKRLEKDNDALKRQKEVTAANVIRMAEERQDWKNRMDAADKKTEKLMSIIQQMQQQGRKVQPATASKVESYEHHQDAAEHGEESDYSEEIEDEGEDSDLDDTEEEMSPPPQTQAPHSGSATKPDKVPFGPERPPIPPGDVAINGH